MSYPKPIITEKIAVLSADNFNSVELNKVSWDGAPAQYDIHSWYTDKFGNLRAGKGIALSDAEAYKLMQALQNEF